MATLAEKLDTAIKERRFNDAIRIINDLPRLTRTDTPEGADRFAAIIRTDNTDIVRRFMNKEAKADALTSDGTRMASVAILGDHRQSFIELLNDKKADLGLPDADGKTPFHHAVERYLRKLPNDFPYWQYLVPRCGDTTLPVAGQLPLLLQLMATTDTPESMRMHAAHAAQNLECRNEKGETPLMVSMQHQDWGGATQALLARGADIYAQDYQGHTVFTKPCTDTDKLYETRPHLQKHLEMLCREVAQLQRGHWANLPADLLHEKGVTAKGLWLCGADLIDDLFAPAWWCKKFPFNMTPPEAEKKYIGVHPWLFADELRSLLPPHLAERVRMTGFMREADTPREDSTLVSYMRGAEVKLER